MIPWIQVYSNLVRHPKVTKLADKLGLTSTVIAVAVSVIAIDGIVARIPRIVIGTVRIALGAAKVAVVRNDIRRLTFVAVLVVPVADLEPTFHDDHAAFFEILGDKFAGLPPCDTVDEVCLFLSFLGEVPVNGNGEAGNSNAAASPPQFRVAGQTTHNCNTVKHYSSSVSPIRHQVRLVSE